MKPMPVRQTNWLSLLPNALLETARDLGAAVFRGATEMDALRMTRGDHVVFLTMDGKSPVPGGPPMPIFSALATITSDKPRRVTLPSGPGWVRDATFMDGARPVDIAKVLGKLSILPDPGRLPMLMRLPKQPMPAEDYQTLEDLMLGKAKRA